MRTAASECRLKQQCEAMFILSYLILYYILFGIIVFVLYPEAVALRCF